LRLSIPRDLQPGDLDFENSSTRRPWVYPGFLVHLSGLELATKDVDRELCRDRERPTHRPPDATAPAKMAGEKTRATKLLVTWLTADREMRPKEAKPLLFEQNLSLGPGQFRDVWRKARVQANLPPRAKPGRDKKPAG
jgi:hypothetical protein